MDRWKPTAGGWLTMLNCVGWLILGTVPNSWWHYPYLHCFWVTLSLPVAWIFFIPTVFLWDEAGVVSTCCLIGFNSFLWGYGLAALLRRWFRQHRDRDLRN